MGKVVVITGASAGVGRAAARAFARRGASLGLIARGRERLDAAREELEGLGAETLALPVDVADAERVDEAASRVEDRFGPIDVWVNNAMVSVFSPALQMTAEEFRRVTEVTYLGQVYGTLAALRRMVPRDHGTVVMVGSALAYRGIALQSAYCAAKHAIQGFTESIRTELRHDGSRVRVTQVHLPAMNTPQFDWTRSRMARKTKPLPPIFQPELGADAIVYAAEHGRRELFVGLPTLAAKLGSILAPGLAERWLAFSGWEDQLDVEPEDAGRPDNLFRPVPGTQAAHGRFDDDATYRSPEWWLSKHRAAITFAGLAAGAAWAFRSRRNR